MTSPHSSSAASPRFVLAAWVGFLLLGLFGVLQHEMWRDELQAWLIARESTSLRELFAHLRYEGHPPLWYLLLYAVSRFTGDPRAMQLLHLALASLAALLFLRFAPFTRLQRLLFVFGYFPAYEYCVKSRGYVIGVLALFAACSLLGRRSTRPLALAAALLLAAQGGILSLLIAGALALALALERARAGRSAPALATAEGSWRGAGWLFAIGILATVALLIPPRDSGYTDPWSFAFDAERLVVVVSRLAHGYLPDPGSTQYRVKTAWDHWAAAALLGWSLLAFLRRPPVLVAYAAGTAAILGFLYGKYPGLIWHHGHFFVLWIVCLWLAHVVPARRLGRPALDAAAAAAERSLSPVLTLILVVHCVTGIRAQVRDWREPYSAARQTAEFIREHRLDRLTLAGDKDFVVMSVAGYLDRGTEIFYIAGERFGSFIVWDERRLRQPPPGRAPIRRAHRLARERGEDVLFVSSYRVPRPLPGFAEPIAAFERRIWPNEQFFLYRLRAGSDASGEREPAD